MIGLPPKCERKLKETAGVVRIVDVPLRKQAAAIDSATNQFRDELERGAIVTIEASRVRVRDP